MKKVLGMDCIFNEMIKYGCYYLMFLLEKLFNDILDSGIFLIYWNIGVIKLIYKRKGDKWFLVNYRGIILMSCLGKLFILIL